MKLAFNEHNPEMGIIGLKKVEFIKSIVSHGKDESWVARLESDKGVFVGYFCMHSDEECQYYLQNDKGTVRVFKTVDAAAAFYSGIVFPNGSCITHVYLGLV